MTDITDHYSVFYINNQIFASETKIYMERRLYNQRNKQSFVQVLQETDWSDIYNIPGTQIWFNTFHGKLVSLLNKSFPKVRINKSGVKRLNTLGHLDQYMAQHGRIVKQSYCETVLVTILFNSN